MDWIKKNYDRAILWFVSLVLLVCSGLLIAKAYGFSETFASIKGEGPHKPVTQAVPTDKLTAAMEALAKPPVWEKRKNEGLLFVSRKYILKDGKLIDPTEGVYQLHPPVPNTWFFENKLGDEILNDDVLDQDPDGDGFTNLDEFSGKTDPHDKNSHPPYVTKLFLEKFIKRPFRLRLEGVD